MLEVAGWPSWPGKARVDGHKRSTGRALAAAARGKRLRAAAACHVSVASSCKSPRATSSTAHSAGPMRSASSAGSGVRCGARLSCFVKGTKSASISSKRRQRADTRGSSRSSPASRRSFCSASRCPPYQLRHFLKVERSAYLGIRLDYLYSIYVVFASPRSSLLRLAGGRMRGQAAGHRARRRIGAVIRAVRPCDLRDPWARRCSACRSAIR